MSIHLFKSTLLTVLFFFHFFKTKHIFYSDFKNWTVKWTRKIKLMEGDIIDVTEG